MRIWYRNRRLVRIGDNIGLAISPETELQLVRTALLFSSFRSHAVIQDYICSEVLK
jgi:hypothetical protein